MHAIETFFSAWSMDTDVSRKQVIDESFRPDGTYIDPRTQGDLTGLEAIASYVAMFHTHAPDWTATVVKSDIAGTCTRVTVAFAGTGPDGNAVVQHGQYFVDMDGSHITRMVGFVGTGAVA